LDSSFPLVDIPRLERRSFRECSADVAAVVFRPEVWFMTVALLRGKLLSMPASFGHGDEDPGKPTEGTRKAWLGVNTAGRTDVTDEPVGTDPPIRSEMIDTAALAVIVALASRVGFDQGGRVRGVLALLFFAFVPGWAVVTNWTSAARLSRVALSVLLSLAISAAAATITLWLHLWSPVGLFYVTASACAVAITASLVRRRARATPEFAEGTRANEAIETAREARPAAVRQAPDAAAHPVDGTQVLVPREREGVVVPPPAVGMAGGTTTGNLVNVNTATRTKLRTLPGIGAVLAGRIVDHRTTNGPFRSVEQLRNVRGIGDTLLASIRERVTV
jgi:comEA protein